jgi:hypothetical protein
VNIDFDKYLHVFWTDGRRRRIVLEVLGRACPNRNIIRRIHQRMSVRHIVILEQYIHTELSDFGYVYTQ